MMGPQYTSILVSIIYFTKLNEQIGTIAFINRVSNVLKTIWVAILHVGNFNNKSLLDTSSKEKKIAVS